MILLLLYSSVVKPQSTSFIVHNPLSASTPIPQFFRISAETLFHDLCSFNQYHEPVCYSQLTSQLSNSSMLELRIILSYHRFRISLPLATLEICPFNHVVLHTFEPPGAVGTIYGSGCFFMFNSASAFSSSWSSNLGFWTCLFSSKRRLISIASIRH